MKETLNKYGYTYDIDRAEITKEIGSKYIGIKIKDPSKLTEEGLNKLVLILTKKEQGLNNI